MARSSITIPQDAQYNDQRHLLLVCNGSSQLLCAVAAAKTLNAWQGARRYLVIQELNAPGNQAEDFSQAIAQMARTVGCWERILYIKPKDIKALSRQNPEAAGQKIQRRIGVEYFDELYMGQNPTTGNQMISNAYRCANRKVCTGDGMGVNFSRDYFPKLQKQGMLGLQSAFRKVLRSRNIAACKSAERLYVKSFDDHCLLLPNLFDERLSNSVSLDAVELKRLLVRIGLVLEDDSREVYRQLAAISTTTSERVVLLTANLSESGRISLADELIAYCSLVGSLDTAKNTMLIIKPHPRDSLEKIGRLRKLLAPMFGQVVALDDARSFYLPFEVLFANYLDTQTATRFPITIVGVSTAPLSLAYLYGAHCVIGFGEDIVRQRFHPEWVDFRLRHEREIQSACDAIRPISEHLCQVA